jgi:hypothetical protein
MKKLPREFEMVWMYKDELIGQLSRSDFAIHLENEIRVAHHIFQNIIKFQVIWHFGFRKK